MAENNISNKLNSFLNDIKERLINLKVRVSRSYICIEFGYDFIQIAEVYYSKNCINFKKIHRKKLPSEALEKGFPKDPEKMGALISDMLREEKIYKVRLR